MTIVALLTGVISFFVDFFLLLGTNRITGKGSSLLRILIAAVLGGVYNGLCVIENLAFLHRPFFRVAEMLALCLIAYGWKKRELQKGAVFALLHMALYGLSLGAGGGTWTPLFAAGALFFLCNYAQPKAGRRFIPVEITHGEMTLKILALKDTGNCLKDPVTGAPVLIVSAKVAEKLTGLTAAQLKDPVGTMGTIPGLRLIPFQTVGMQNGMLLAMRFSKVKIGCWQGSKLVAFAPEGLDNAEFQGLTGGIS